MASELAIEVLKDGGNAFDAAFALAFSLCISHPQAGNVGGGGYLVYREGRQVPRTINFREQAPRAATREAFMLPDGNPDPDKTAFGPMSVCVPGTVKAFFTLQARHGKLKARDLMTAIARLADDGALLTHYEAECMNRLGPRLAASPEARKHYVRDTPWSAGDRLRNPALARTFEVLAREGEGAFYRGAIAEQIVSDLSKNGGFLSMEDLAAYELRESEAISLEIAGRRVWTVPPEGGGAMLLEILGLLDRDEVKHHAWGSAGFHHYLAQASKLAFIRRGDYLGDVDLTANVAYRQIFDPAALERRFACIDPLRDTPTDRLAEKAGAAATAPSRDVGKNTTHFAVIDAEGNAVSCSYTMNLRYGSKWAIEGAGFLVNGSMDSFSFVEGRENYFGVIGSAPNRFAPGKHPASNMAPTLVTRDGETEMALGTPGGPTIPTALGAILAATLFHGVPAVQAVATARLHDQGWPDKLSHEPGFPDTALLATLSEMGYPVKDKQELISDIQGVFKDGDAYQAVSDWRREGRALALQ